MLLEDSARGRAAWSPLPAEAARTAVSVHDRAEAIGVLRRAHPGMVFELGGDGPFLLRRSTVGNARLMSTELLLSGPARAVGELDDEGGVAVLETLAGGLVLEGPHARVETGPPFLRPSGPVRIRSEDLHLRTTQFGAGAFRAAVEQYERGGVVHRLVPGAPADPAAAAAWSWTAAHVQRTLRDPRSSSNAILVGELFDLAVRTLLTCFADRARTGAAGGEGSPKALRRAIAYLEQHALGAVAVPDVAAAAQVSVRSLQSLFRRHLGVSPIEHLHAIRLDGARRELVADVDGVTVREVAERWGFGNSGRFARLYHQRFGERPSETLRAGR